MRRQLIERHWYLVFLTVCLTCALSARAADRRPAAKQKTDPTANAGGLIPLGKLPAFWRNAPALGPYHETGHRLIEIPAYATQGDFAYHPKEQPHDVPFADHLTMVRFLGGFNANKDPSLRSRDLASRNADGKIEYHWNLLEPRLRPYLDAGYRELTIVLDNVPWCFPKKPEAVGLGQKSPPRDTREWYDFIVALCEQLKALLGEEAANNLRFRVGTENNGRERFDGSHEEYIRHYQASAAAVKSVLPKAKIGPCNFSGVSLRAFNELQNVRGFEFVGSCLKGRNPFSGEVGTPIDFIAFSRYYQPDEDITDNVRRAAAVWDKFEERYPQLKGVSREVHEFGIAPFGNEARGDFISKECGALGVATTSLMMFRLLERGVDRVFHWDTTDLFRDRKRVLHRVFTSYAWLLSVLERMVGGEAYLIEPVRPSTAGTEFLGLVSAKPGETWLVFTAHNRKTDNHTAETVEFHLPRSIAELKSKQIECVVLDRKSSVHDQIRADLAEAGLLVSRFVERPDRNGGIREMGDGRAGEIFVGERLESYHQQWQKSLTLAPLKPNVGSIETAGEVQKLTLHLAPPQLVVLVAR